MPEKYMDKRRHREGNTSYLLLYIVNESQILHLSLIFSIISQGGMLIIRFYIRKLRHDNLNDLPKNI